MSALTPSTPFPMINGIIMSYAQIRVQISGVVGLPVIDIFDIDSIDYSYKVDIREKWLTSPFPIARYSRRMESEAHMEMSVGTQRAFLQFLMSSGIGGVTDVSFQITVVYQATQAGKMFVDVLHGCRLKGSGQTNAVGGKHLTTKMPIAVNWISLASTEAVASPGTT